jgi:hypothetical protein
LLWPDAEAVQRLVWNYCGQFLDKNVDLSTVGELLADNIAECRNNMLEILAGYLNVDESDDLYRAAVMGMLERVDPAMHKWNKLLSPSQYAELHRDLEGEVVGVGVKIRFDSASGYIDVLGAVPGTPADRAGLAPPDSQELERLRTELAGLEVRQRDERSRLEAQLSHSERLASLGILISIVWAVLLHRTDDAQNLWREAARRLEQAEPPVEGEWIVPITLRSGATLEVNLLRPFEAHAQRFARAKAVSWLDRVNPSSLTELLPLTFLGLWSAVFAIAWVWFLILR